MNIERYHIIRVNNYTPQYIIEKEAANPSAVLDITDLTDFEKLPSRLRCNVLSKNLVFNSRHLTDIEGRLILPQALNVSFPHLVNAKAVHAPKAGINNKRIKPYRLMVSNNTPIPLLRQAAADPHIILDVTHLDFLDHLLANVRCQIYSEKKHFDSENLKCVEGGIDLPYATVVILPHLTHTKHLIAPKAVAIQTPRLVKIAEDIIAINASNFHAPFLENIRDMHLTQALNVDLPQLKQSRNTEAPNATFFNTPSLVETSNAFLGNAIAVNMDNIIVMGDLWANLTPRFIAPHCRIAGFVHIASALEVNLENLTKIIYLDAESSQVLKITKLSYEEFRRAVYAPQAYRASINTSKQPHLPLQAHSKLNVRAPCPQ